MRVKRITNNAPILHLVNHVVYTAHATDRDSGENGKVSYSLYQVIAKATTAEPFKIDRMTGELSIDNPIDYEKVDSYRVIIKAQDGSPTNPRYSEKMLLVSSPVLFSSMVSILEINCSGKYCFFEKVDENISSIFLEFRVSGQFSLL